MTDHYAALGLKPDASQDAIRRAFKKLVFLAHPDKGGDAAHFIAIRDAYEALTGDSTIDLIEDEDDDDVRAEADEEYESGSADGSQCESDYNYGYRDLEETGGSYAVELEDGSEISLEEHERLCGCDLDGEFGHTLLMKNEADDDEGYQTGEDDVDMDEDSEEEEAALTDSDSDLSD